MLPYPCPWECIYILNAGPKAALHSVVASVTVLGRDASATSVFTPGSDKPALRGITGHDYSTASQTLSESNNILVYTAGRQNQIICTIRIYLKFKTRKYAALRSYPETSNLCSFRGRKSGEHSEDSEPQRLRAGNCQGSNCRSANTEAKMGSLIEFLE